MYTMRFLFFLALLLLCASCHAPRTIGGKTPETPLEKALSAYARDLDSVLSRPDLYDVQIMYTQIDRDATQKPRFQSYYWNVDSTRYFYPASTVKMPLALLSLEKINRLRQRAYPKLNRDTPYRLDSLRAFQQAYSRDAGAPQGKASVAHDVRQIFVVSDNLAYNHLFEFLGRNYINQTLREKGYTRTGIVHRFNYPGRDNRFSSPITFYDGAAVLYKEGEKQDETQWKNPQTYTQLGVGYIDNRDSLVQGPFDFSTKNWFALTDMERMLRAVIFPEYVPEKNRFELTEDDYRFLWHYMGLFPRECDYPTYDTTHYPDGYVKFFLMGDTRERQDGHIRLFGKTGQAYGQLTDVSYVVDFDSQTEFILAATIRCNSDGIFNDDRYDYDRVGFPFISKLGKAVYEYDKKRKRKVKPNLSKFRL